MRPTVLLISAIAHVPLVAYIAHIAVAPRGRPQLRGAIRAEVKPPASAAPIEVTFLVEAEEVTAKLPRTPRTPRHEVKERSASFVPSATRSPTASERIAPPSVPIFDLGVLGDLGSLAFRSEDGATDEVHRGTGTGLMRMRGPDLDLDPQVAERIAAAGHKPDELRRSGKLKSQPGGGAIIHDRVTTMTVEPDGSANFDDLKDIDPQFKLPIPKIWQVEEMRQQLGHELTEWFKDPEAGKRYGTTADLPRHLQASPGACDSWGATMCDDPLAPQIEQRVRELKKVNGAFLGGPLDITAWLHRKFIGDPYSSRKLKLLTDTFDERVAMGTAHRAEQSARSAELMQKNLEWLWAREHDPIARRAALFELWDECTEDDAGARARALVIGWIRARLPAGSPDAYTAAELDVLQMRRTSTAAFAPYDD